MNGKVQELMRQAFKSARRYLWKPQPGWEYAELTMSFDDDSTCCMQYQKGRDESMDGATAVVSDIVGKELAINEWADLT